MLYFLLLLHKNNNNDSSIFVLFSVTSISVIDTQAASFTSQNETCFPSLSTSTYSMSSNTSTTNTTTGTNNNNSTYRVNQQQNKNTTPTTPVVLNNNNNLLLNDWSDIIRLPNAAIRQLKTSPSKEEQRSLAKIVFYSYKNLHQLLSDADQQLTGADALEGEHLVVNSRIISASIDGTLSSAGEARITEPVLIRFQHLQKTTAAPDDVVCVYWDLVRNEFYFGIHFSAFIRHN